MSIVGNNIPAIRYASLEWKNVTQMIIKNAGIIGQLSSVFRDQKSLNGIMEYINTGLKSYEDYELETKVSNYNPSDIPMESYAVVMDNKWVYRVNVPSTFNLMTGFVGMGQKIEFKKWVIRSNSRSLAKDLERYRFTTLLTQKIVKTQNNTVTAGGPAGKSFHLDGDTSLDTWIKGDKSIDKENILTGLEQMRKQLIDFRTLGDHTKFSRDNAADEYVYSFKPTDFMVVWNSKYHSAISTARANVYNDNQILLKVPEQIVVDFASSQMSTKMTASEKATSAKTICYIVHKDALVINLPTGDDEVKYSFIQTPNFKEIHSMLFMFGINRMLPFPIIRYTEK